MLYYFETNNSIIACLANVEFIRMDECRIEVYYTHRDQPHIITYTSEEEAREDYENIIKTLNGPNETIICSTERYTEEEISRNRPTDYPWPQELV